MAAAAPAKVWFPEPVFDRKIFTDWNLACRVRQIADRSNEMMENASDENMTLEEYKKKNEAEYGKDHSGFLLTCPQYKLTCWPSEFAEIGSGFVLYFHFLIFMGVFLFISFLVQMPAVMEYWDKDDFAAWQRYGSRSASVQAGKTQKNEVLDNMFIYTSPGMLGPLASDNSTIPFIYFVLVCLLCFCIVVVSALQVRVDHTVDEGTTAPNDFAIMVEGLPPTASDEQAIMNFFKANAVRGQSETEVVKVVIGWDSKEYREMQQRKKDLCVTLAGFALDDGRRVHIENAIRQINADLESSSSDVATRLQNSGVVVVSFRYQADLRRCLDRWTSVWATWAYRDWGKCCGMFGGESLAKFPTAQGVGVWKISVKRAPNPGDINWDDLGVPRNERLKLLAQTNGAMVCIMGISLVFLYGMIKVKEGSTETWTSLLPTFGISLANLCVQVAAKKLGEKEIHNTVSGQQGSQAIKMTLGMVVNTAILMLVVNPYEEDWYKKNGLVSDIVILIASTGVMQPLFQNTDIKYSVFGAISRRGLTNELVKEMREGAEYYNTTDWVPKTPGPERTEAVDQYKAFTRKYNTSVNTLKSAFEPSDMDMKKRYATSVRTFVVCMCYCPLVPFVSLLGILGIAVQYWTDKRMLTQWYKHPAIPQGMNQAAMSLYFLRFTTLLMPLTMWFFISPSYKNNDQIIKWMALSYVPAVFLCVMPLKTIRKILFAPCRGRNRKDRVTDTEMEDYYAAQYLWPTAMKYHMSHNLYKGLPKALNPEMLDPAVSAATQAADVKSSYGASAKIAATKADAGAASTTGTGPATTGVTPTVIGGPSGDPPGGGPAAVVTVVSGDPSGGAGVAAAASSSSSGPVWEMELKDNRWSNFDDDCLDHLEKKFQQFKASGKGARITIKTKGMALSVDFEKMSQMKKESGKGRGKGGHNKVHKIRRSEPP